MMRNQIFPRLALSAVVVTAGSATLFAQQTASNQPASKADAKPATTIKTPAHDVLLEVTVRDKKGALVSSVDKGALELTEDGRPQTIQSFALKADEPYKLGLLVETSHSVGAALPEVGKSADQFVDTMLPAEAGAKGGDKAFLIHFDRQVELLEDFTASREKLHSELDELSATRQSRDDGQGPETTGDDRERPTRARNASQLYDAIFLACDELMKHQDGRKVLVVFSDGVDSGSKDTLNDAVDAADRAGVEIYTIYMKGQQQEDNFGNNGHRRGGLGYPGGGGGYPGGGGGYPGGGGGYPGGGGQRRESKPIVDGKKMMEEIARRTGGHAYEAKKRDDLGPIYKLIGDELHGQYLLTYTPDKPDADGGYHKVALKANKGDLSVVTREGYYAPGGADSK